MPDLSAAITDDWNAQENSVPNIGVHPGNPIEDTLRPDARQTAQDYITAIRRLQDQNKTLRMLLEEKIRNNWNNPDDAASEYGSIAGLDDNEPDYGKIKTVNADIARSGNIGYTGTAAKNDTDSPAPVSQFSFAASNPTLYGATVEPLQGDDASLPSERQAIIRRAKRDYNTAYDYYQTAVAAGDLSGAAYWKRQMNESHRAAEAARGGANAALSDLVAAANGTVTYNPEKHRATITVNGVEKTAYFYGEDDDTTTANIDGQTFAVHNDHILMNSDQFDKLFGNNAIVNTTSGTQYISSVKSTVAPDKVSVVVTTTFPDMIANNTVYGGKSVDNSFKDAANEGSNSEPTKPADPGTAKPADPGTGPINPGYGDEVITGYQDSSGANASGSASGDGSSEGADQSGNHVTADQLKIFGWHNTSDEFIKKLNDTLNHYGITDKNSIALFLATMANESAWGYYTLEIWDPSAKHSYSKNERGAGYIQLTWDRQQRDFLKSMGDDFSGEDTATYIANNYPLEASAWFWSKAQNTGENNLNAYTTKYGSSLGLYLVSQYFVNGLVTDRNGKANQAFMDDLAYIRKGGSFKINKENKKSVSLSVNGNTWRLPQNWDDRENAYNKAKEALGI